MTFLTVQFSLASFFPYLDFNILLSTLIRCTFKVRLRISNPYQITCQIRLVVIDDTKLTFNSLKCQLNVPKMSLKYILFLATCFGHTRPSSGNMF
jgi:hypothetical protein